MTIRAVVRGIGHYLPERVVPNSEFEDTLDTSHEWIVSRSGIHQARTSWNVNEISISVGAAPKSPSFWWNVLPDAL